MTREPPFGFCTGICVHDRFLRRDPAHIMRCHRSDHSNVTYSIIIFVCFVDAVFVVKYARHCAHFIFNNVAWRRQKQPPLHKSLMAFGTCVIGICNINILLPLFCRVCQASDRKTSCARIGYITRLWRCWRCDYRLCRGIWGALTWARPNCDEVRDDVVECGRKYKRDFLCDPGCGTDSRIEFGSDLIFV